MSHSIIAGDIKVSQICLGTMTFGTPVPQLDAVRMVHWALDHGINFLDTADMYEGYKRSVGSAGGVAEQILGEALYGRRDRAVITTKVGSDVGEGANLKPDYIRKQIDKSLSRMRTDYVDFYEFHRPDPHTPLVESIAVMAELIKAGKVRFWGSSNFEAPQIQEMVELCDAHNWPRPVIHQPAYSWLNREIEEEILPACRRFNIAVTPYQPLGGGLLTGKYHRDQAPPGDSRASQSPWLASPD